MLDVVIYYGSSLQVLQHVGVLDDCSHCFFFLHLRHRPFIITFNAGSGSHSAAPRFYSQSLLCRINKWEAIYSVLWRLKRCLWSAMAIIILLVSIIPVNAPLKQRRSRRADKAINNFIQGNMRAPRSACRGRGGWERCGANWEGKVIWGREAMSEYWCHPPPRFTSGRLSPHQSDVVWLPKLSPPRLVQKIPAHLHAHVHTVYRCTCGIGRLTARIRNLLLYHCYLIRFSYYD